MGYEEETTVNLGLPYYDSLLPEEQQEVTEAVKLLLRQTFVLERKYEKRSGRFTNNREFRICNKHLEFLRKYFAVSHSLFTDIKADLRRADGHSLHQRQYLHVAGRNA